MSDRTSDLDSGLTASRVIRVTPANQAAAVAEAARIVSRGGVIAFPTETVYGVGASASGDAGRLRLAALKGRDPDKPIALLLSDFAHAERYTASVPPLAMRLASKYCPGPITLVLPGVDGATLGVRVPDHGLALALIEACGGALLATSANVSGAPPARSAAEVLAALPEGLDLVLDGGAAPIGTASTVVRVDGDSYQILRIGAVPEQEVAALAAHARE